MVYGVWYELVQVWWRLLQKPKLNLPQKETIARCLLLFVSHHHHQIKMQHKSMNHLLTALKTCYYLPLSSYNGGGGVGSNSGDG